MTGTLSAKRMSFNKHLPAAGDGLVLNQSPALDQCPAAVYLSQLKHSSRRPQKQALNLVATLLSGGHADCLTINWAAVRYQHTAAVRGRLLDSYSPATANRILSAIRGVLEQTWLLGQMSAEDYHRAARLPAVIGETLPAGRELLQEEIVALLQNCQEDSRPIGTRDAAVIAMLLGTGLRREEVTTLDIGDFNAEGAKLIVRGKRSKQRTAYLGEGPLAALNDWLELRGRDSGSLFLSVTKAGSLVYGRRLTPQAIYHLLRSWGQRSGVKSFTPHDLRRTFVSKLLNAGVDIAIVAKMAGHSNIQTTARYDRRPEEARQRAAQLIQIPYVQHTDKSRGIKELPTCSWHHTYYC